MRRQDLDGAVLWMLSGALLLFSAGLLFALSAWDRAATDRAYVEAAARAEHAGSPALRVWVPQQDATATARLWQQQWMLDQQGGQPKGRP